MLTQDVSLKTTNVNLMVVLESVSYLDSSSHPLWISLPVFMRISPKVV